MQNPSVVIIDNYDSFTHNLFHYVKSFTSKCTVLRNDQTSLKTIEKFDKIILSPGPGLPKDAGITLESIDYFHKKKPILGVCLGHQAIAEYFGAQLYNLKKVMHGKQTKIKVLNPNDPLFTNCPKLNQVGRYHSWAVNKESITNTSLNITSVSEDGVVMSMRHNLFNVCAVQFHPESILTEYGKKMIENWVNK